MADKTAELLRSDWGVEQLLHRAKTEPDAAAELLQIAALYLRRAMTMPVELAEYIANAFSKAADAEILDRRDTLAAELHLQRKANAPVKVRPTDVVAMVMGHDYHNEIKTNKTPRLEKQLVSDIILRFKVSDSKARSLIKAARAHYRAEW
ncbi:hypothetical protein [Gemmobacter sp. LW-1]|uniref:hypothetical protein n=1 Tax=Gemmobacter sp. LW-1 TaxID=1529005 RepID=UPI0006C763E7|nr:hypothetical protein [Gemmobacter sp. LW-1]